MKLCELGVEHGLLTTTTTSAWLKQAAPFSATRPKNQLFVFPFQDTVLSIGFLADFAEKFSSNDEMNIAITMRPDNSDRDLQFATITRDNTQLVQRKEVRE